MSTEWPHYLISRETSCVFGLVLVFAQHLPSQNNTKQTERQPKRHNKPKTKTFMKLLRDYQSVVTIHSLDPALFCFKCCSRIVCWICFGCYAVLAVFWYTGSCWELPSCSSSFTQFSFSGFKSRSVVGKPTDHSFIFPLSFCPLIFFIITPFGAIFHPSFL